MAVLVVDDHPLVLAFLARVLADEGYDVLMAENGQVALDIVLAQAGGIQLVISDLRMPVMGGLELATHLSKLASAPPVLLISGYETAAGAILYPVLPKPFTPNQLARHVRSMLDGSPQA